MKAPPDGWRSGKFEDFVFLQRGFDLTKENSGNGNVPVISSSGLSYYHDTAMVDPPGVVTGRKGSLGKVWFVDVPFWPHDTTLWVKDFKGNDPHYVKVFLEKLDLASFDAATSVPTLNRNNLHGLKIAFPPLPEQKKIAAILSTWDRAIELTEKLIAAKQKRKQALMQKLLTGKVQIGGIATTWKRKSLGTLATFINGRAFKPSEWVASGIPIIRIQNLNGSADFNYFQGDTDDRHRVYPNDLLFSWSGSRGTSFGPCFWHGQAGVLNQHIFKVMPKPEVQQRYLGYALEYVTVLIENKAHGSAGLVHVTKKELERYTIGVPTLPVQERIAAVIDNAGNEISLLNRRLDFLKQQKKGLMQQLLTGDRKSVV